MITCIQQVPNDTDVRLINASFYNDIVRACNVQDFGLQLEAMIHLTKGGTVVEDFFKSPEPFPEVLDSWFRILSEETQKVRFKKKSDIAKPWGSSTEENFHDFLRFTITIYQHNHILFSTRNTADFLDRVNKTCRTTSDENDIIVCLDLVDTIQKFAYIPLKSLPDMLETLCGILAKVPVCQEKTWDIIEDLFHGSLSINMFHILLELTANPMGKINMNTTQGATIALRRIVQLSVDTNRQFEFPVTDVLMAYTSSVMIESSRQNLEVTSCIFEMLADDDLRNRLFNFEIWNSRKLSPLEVIYTIGSSRLVQKYAGHQGLDADSFSYHPLDSAMSQNSSTRQASSRQIELVDRFQKLFTLLADLFESNQFTGPKETIIDFFADMYQFIDDRCAHLVISSFRELNYCHPVDRNWKENAKLLASGFFYNSTRSPSIRLLALDVLYEVYILVREICDIEAQLTIVDLIFHIVETGPDVSIFKSLVDKFVHFAEDAAPESISIASKCLLLAFTPPPDTTNNSTNPNHRRSIGSVNSSLVNELSMTSSISTSPQISSIPNHSEGESPMLIPIDLLGQYRPLVAVGFCKVFLSVFQYSALKARSAYYDLITICQRSLALSDALSFLEVARLLCRIRSTTEGYIYLNVPTNMDGLSASVGRNISALGPPADTSAMLWWYPETPSFILEEHLNIPSATLKRYSEENFETQRLRSNEYEIDISLWFNEIIGIFENGATWEIYSFAWAHFGPQLSNLELFRTSGSDIHRLRQIICDQLANSKLPNVTYPKDITRFDLLISIVRTMSSLIAYHSMFTKQDGEEIVKALVNGLSSWEKTSVSCIHALVVCCHELPLPIKKHLGQIFTKFQTKITNTSTSPHILEFLLSLSRLPTLVDNFTQDEYKRVFGMAFKYIQYAYTLSQQAESKNNNANTSSSTDSRTLSPVSSPVSGPAQTSTITDSKKLSQYLLFLAYSVVATWFLTLKMEDRKYLAKFITRNLILAVGTNESIDTQGMAYIDLISRFTYSDLDLTIQTTISLPSFNEPNRKARQWIYGNSIVSIDTDEHTGDTYVVVRRPTGTTMLTLKPDERIIPDWLEDALLKRNDKTLEFDRISGGIPTAFSPNYFMLQVMYPTGSHTAVKPIPLPSDAATSRAIGAFDRTPVVDFHKIGILYIGPGQQEEQEILSNSVGSPNYRRFLESLGNLVRLKGNKKIYTGGLDTNSDIDGEYAYIWADKVTQMIFHTTTMMPAPANPEDKSFSSKKRHIGNDFVNIYFDESELPFKFDVIKSQFNFINIVITPVSVNFSKHKVFTKNDETPGSPMIKPVRPIPGEEHSKKMKMYFKVRAYCKPGVPAIFAACHLKIVSEESLAGFVRNLALISSKFAMVWNNHSEYWSNWQYRLEQINALREKVTSDMNKAAHSQPAQANNKGHQRGDSFDNKEVGQSFLDQLAGGGGLGGLGGGAGEGSETLDKRDSTSKFMMESQDDDDFPLLKALDFTSFTNQ